MAKSSALYVVAYDIPSDKRRNKVHKALSGFGQWTQYSLFELFLNDRELVLLQNKLEKLLDPQTDSLRFYRLCEDCRKAVETVGAPPPEEAQIFLA